MEWTHEDKSDVWNKAKTVNGNDKNIFRKDKCGAWINWNQYGDRESQYGWEIDHIIPSSKGGGDELGNLQPLQWENNLSKSDGGLECAVTSKGKGNGSV